MEKLKEFVISRNSIETGLEVEVSVKTKEEKSNIESIVSAVEVLIESIDLKHTCNEDFGLHQDTVKRILFMVADAVGVEGGYDHIDFEYDEETDEPIIPDSVRIELLESIVKGLK